MSEWWLIGALVLLALLAIGLMLYPLRNKNFICILLTPCMLLVIAVAYFCWGGFGEWQNYLHQQSAQLRARELLKTVKSPQELIEKLKNKIAENPDRAKGWYLLGRLYTSQSDHKNASLSFAKAYQLEPTNEQYAVNYAHSLWQLQQQQFTPEIIRIFGALLKNNPKQPDALAMLAMNAFLSHAYEDAIGYWQRLLALVPEQSKEAVALRKAIAKAQERVKLIQDNN